ncbi:hypothetical protein [Brevibacterium antiquum]|uniref:hypothetical protein n=1 Tax=Brevibacterium antiquum TaxID=234835 RepID=UPI001E555552|nr:hypothetical protein [Brevibacterium antiquum]
MGVTEMISRLALRVVRVLIVEVPGQWLTRMELEHQMLRRGWRRALTAADADVLAVCGVSGPELTPLVDRLWQQMPGPRVRADMVSPRAVNSALDEAAILYLDTEHHKRDAQERAQEPWIPEGPVDHMDHDDHGNHAGMGHDNHEGHGGMNHDDHAGMNHNDHDEHAGMKHDEHAGVDHGEHEGHGGMDMSPGGVPLAEGGQDRDGLEMDVLHLPLGPVLPYWPAGLVLTCSIQGDVVIGSDVSIVDSGDHGNESEISHNGLRAALHCDSVMALLALAGADDLAARARRARDFLLRGDQVAASDALVRMTRAIRRSWLLRWSLRGILVLDQVDLDRYGLSVGCGGDAYDRMLRTIDRVRAEVDGRVSASEEDELVPWQVLPELVSGMELATLRLAVASVNLELCFIDKEVEHDR